MNLLTTLAWNIGGYEVNPMAVTIFATFVLFVLGLSFYLGNKAKSSSGYFAAGGTIHWSVNGISFAGDYLSAASFLGICGMIATVGYDGYLYSIGYLAGWIVALFVVAEPMKRMGKYTFTDALDNLFNNKGIQLAAAISTLAVSVFYLIPQMVGAGALVTPLLGLPHWVGVVMVGIIVITIVATAGMTSTTYVQFLKGALLIIFSLVLVIAMCWRGLSTQPNGLDDEPPYEYTTVQATVIKTESGQQLVLPAGWEIKDRIFKLDAEQQAAAIPSFIRMSDGNELDAWFHVSKGEADQIVLDETQWISTIDGKKAYNDDTEAKTLRDVGRLTEIKGKSGEEADTGSTGPFSFLSNISDPETTVMRWSKGNKIYAQKAANVYYWENMPEGSSLQIFYSILTPGNEIMRPGQKFKVQGTLLERLDFISLMLALFCGTAALPHVLIRYYTVPSPACARKSTILAIAAIGFFYILTMYLGLGAMVNNVVNPESSNMSAPLLAKSFNMFLFAVISAIAFATVLGTVSGLIVAASGAVAHDVMDNFLSMKMSDKGKVRAGKIAAFAVGAIAIVLGIVFKGMNVSFLVGWAFAVAASANLPAIVMILFWKRTTAKGIVASIIVGTIAAIGIILISPDMFVRYGQPRPEWLSFFQLNQPGIVAIPLSFITLVVVSLMTERKTVDMVEASSTEDAKAD